MPVGMTLQQLYAQPSYHGDAVSTAVGQAPTSAAMSAASAPAKRPPSINTSAPPQRPAAYADHHAAAMQQQQQQQPQQQHYAPQYGQLPPPHAYAQYLPPKPHGASGNAPSDEYGIADPLPFEYMGMRKFPDVQPKDAQPDHRYANPTQYPGNYSAHSPHPSVYESQHVHPPKSVEDRAYHQPYTQHHPAERAYHNAPDAANHYTHPPMPSHMYATSAPMNTMAHNVHHSFPPLIDTQNLKKDTIGDRDAQQYSPHGPVEYASGPVAAPGGASQEAVIKVKTPLKTKYWRNGRRNLQCFPSCKVFGDYSSIKIEDLKQHDFMWGKCRGSLITEVTLNSSVSFDDILILGRVHSLENVPVAFEEAVIRECMLGRMVEPEAMDGMKDQWITGERLPDFVQQEGNTACYEFKPKVWKYTEDMTQGKCKRRNVKYYVQFEAFVLVMSGERRYYACIGSGMSTAFEVGSSRVLARQKRKASTGLDANPLYMKPGQGGASSPTDMGPPGMPHPMMPHHGMMPPQHAMHSQMYQPNYTGQGYPTSRGMPPAMQQHPGMMNQMQHHPDNGASLHYAQSMPQQAPMPVPASSGGQKRKPSPGADRVAKAKKTKEVAAM